MHLHFSSSISPFNRSPTVARFLIHLRWMTQVLETGAPHLFMSSFNEHTGGRQTSEFPNVNTAINMGLP